MAPVGASARRETARRTELEEMRAREPRHPQSGALHPYGVTVTSEGQPILGAPLVFTWESRDDRDAAAIALAHSPQTIRVQVFTRARSGAAMVNTWSAETEGIGILRVIIATHRRATAELPAEATP